MNWYKTSFGILILSILIAGPDRHVAAIATAPTPSTGQASSRESSQKDVDRILDNLSRAGKALCDYSATFSEERSTSFPVPDNQTRTGTVKIARCKDTFRFRVSFDRFFCKDGQPISTIEPELYIFDGEWLIEQHDSTRSVQKRQLAKQSSANTIAIAAGAFPLPIGQSSDEVRANFSVFAIPPSADGPPNCDTLLCIVKQNTRLAQTWSSVVATVDRSSGLPIHIVTSGPDGIVVTKIKLNPICINCGIPDSEFKHTVPRGYDVFIEKLPSPSTQPR